MIWTDLLTYAGIVATTFGGMELVAWAAHKYLMHGILWSWHEDHHRPHFEKEGFFERNDLFFVVFAIPSALSYFIGSHLEVWWLFCVGIGISLYGLTYFLIHDVYIHRRFKWFSQLESRYARALVRAHGAHHADTGKVASESYGLLLVDRKYFSSRPTASQ